MFNYGLKQICFPLTRCNFSVIPFHSLGMKMIFYVVDVAFIYHLKIKLVMSRCSSSDRATDAVQST